MRLILLLSFSLSLFSCQKAEKKIVEVPWFVKERIKDDRTSDYNYADSLKKYTALNLHQIENLANYYSYMANLNFMVDPEQHKKALGYLNLAFELNPTSCCEELIQQAAAYLEPNGRPLRRYNMPYLLDLDLEYFFRKLKACRATSKDSIAPLSEQEELKLRMSYINLKDQWFRIPSRKENPTLQKQYDIENRQELDRLMTQFNFPKEDTDLRQNIFVLLLHSTDCDWTTKHLEQYIQKYRTYDQYEAHLKHFLWRSSCTNEALEKRIQEELQRSQ